MIAFQSLFPALNRGDDLSFLNQLSRQSDPTCPHSSGSKSSPIRPHHRKAAAPPFGMVKGPLALVLDRLGAVPGFLEIGKERELE